MLIADLTYYPDSRTTSDSVRMGLAVFKKKDDRVHVGFIEWSDLAEARLQVDDPVLLSIMGDVKAFFRRIAATAAESTEQATAEAVANGLSHNLALSLAREPAPPEMEDLLCSIAELGDGERAVFTPTLSRTH